MSHTSFILFLGEINKNISIIDEINKTEVSRHTQICKSWKIKNLNMQLLTVHKIASIFPFSCILEKMTDNIMIDPK